MGSIIRMAHPRVPEEVWGRLQGIMESGLFISGKEVRAFEGAISGEVGGRSVVAVSSGTMASYLAFLYWKSCGVGRVVMPAFSFPSVASAAMLAGLRVELADIDSERLAMVPSALDGVERGCLAMTVDSFGIPGHVGEWAGWQESGRGIWLEDAACALGSYEAGIRCGQGGRMAFLSFHPRKVLTTGEGGAVVCDGGEAEAIRVLRNLGMEVSGGERRFGVLGVNGRMSELHAAVGNAHMSTLPWILAQRRELGREYVSRLRGIEGISVPAGYGLEGVNFQSMVVRLDRAEWRSGLLRGLSQEGIEATVAGFFLPAEASFSGVGVLGAVEESRKLGADGVALPIHEQMSLDDIERVCGVVGEVLGRLKRS